MVNWVVRLWYVHLIFLKIYSLIKASKQAVENASGWSCAAVAVTPDVTRWPSKQTL